MPERTRSGAASNSKRHNFNGSPEVTYDGADEAVGARDAAQNPSDWATIRLVLRIGGPEGRSPRRESGADRIDSAAAIW